ncbi:MAG: Ig-like domain-containing protein [Clostridium sp.]|uniref:major tail protein n=1 Tax=Clostridium sp. TaxID=1506 RepID=UPI00290B23EB|nr:major tail protein [Clostridium sp.]MDU7339043.1 Ig-like domain-containing protein [Clostridium sp.]
MAFKGCRYPKYCPYTVTQNPDGTETETMGIGKVFGKSANVTITINAAPAKYHADDGTAEVVTEFTGGTLETEMDNLTDTTNAEIGGHRIDEDGVVHYGSEDSPPYLKYSIIVPERVSGKNKFLVKELTRVQFAPPGGSYNSKTDTTALSGIKLNGEIMRAADGEYQKEAVFDTEAQALAWQAAEMNMGGEIPEFTHTSVPVNGATGVNKTDPIILMFSNVVDHGNATLINASTNAVIPATKVFGGGKKTLAITPTAALAASTEYLVVMDVTDAYAQQLSAVVSFTTGA